MMKFIKIILLNYCLLLTTANATSNEISGQLDEITSANFEDYLYDIYQFEKNDQKPSLIALTSSDFDASLIIIKPDGLIQTESNHDAIDQSSEIKALNLRYSDPAILLTQQKKGTWYALVSSIYSKNSGAYTLYAPSLVHLKKVDTSAITPQQVETAFAERGVLTDAEKSRREEVQQQKKIKELAELLEVDSFRQQLESELQQDSNQTKQTLQEKRFERESLQKQKQQLQESINHLSSFPSKHTLAIKLLNEQLETNIEAIKGKLEREKQLQDGVTAIHTTLLLLQRLNNLNEQLKTVESNLLAESDPIKTQTLKDKVKEQRTAWKQATQEIANKLIQADIINTLRFSKNDRTYRYHLTYSHKSNGLIYHPFLASIQRQRIVDEIHNGECDPLTCTYDNSESCNPLFSNCEEPLPTLLGNLTNTNTIADTSELLPSLFPWPPPPTSAQAVIAPQFFHSTSNKAHLTLGDINTMITSSLRKTNYTGSKYYSVPQGFAIITTLEQTHTNGSPLAENLRWLRDIIPIKTFSIAGYLQALFTAPAGDFRVIAFIVTNKAFSSDGSDITFNTINTWIKGGYNTLPTDIKKRIYTDDYNVTAMIYAFKKKSRNDNPEINNSGLTAAQHLAHTEFAAYLL
ncbi:MAG: hypothetical protein ACWA5R_07080 [bacterium]